MYKLGIVHCNISLFSFWMYHNTQQFSEHWDNRKFWVISGTTNGLVAMAYFLTHVKK